MKINILYNFQQGPWGGGNKFLKALRKEFEYQSVYEENPVEAKVILFNSHHNFNEVFKLKTKFPQKIFVHRINGPIQLVRGKDEILDKVIYQFNNLVADGIIFQSNWCKKQNKQLFNISATYETVIYNAPDNKIFNVAGKRTFNPKGKIRLIAVSWSSNWRKGFGIYKFLDENLDFSKYEMTFVGNSPIEFKNIKWIKPVSSEKLAEILKQHDIYITASENDPCSNSLLEALSCGLPAIALNNGGHPELVREGGELFRGKEDIIEKIEKVTRSYHYYQSKIPEFLIEEVAKQYFEFAKKIHEDYKKGIYQLKQVDFLTKINFYKMKLMILEWKINKGLTLITQKSRRKI